VFDPERDEEPGHSRYYLRLLVVMVIAAAGCVALWPSVSGFAAGPDHQTGCLAITDGWHAEKSGPNLEKLPFPPPPTAAERSDPIAMARWRAEWQASQQRPEVQQAIAYLDWKDGPGACIAKSRHRLIMSGIGLAAIAAISTGIALVIRTRKDPASKRRVDPELVNA
jgi:hypothetical protein